jgi:putative sterol carrier protein
MGMPFAFNARAARGVEATIQFHVSGDEPGAYYLRVARGRCESFAGTAHAPNVTVHTPGDVWVRIAHGELDGTQAIERGLYRVEGDLTTFVSIQTWFPPRTPRS